MQSKEILYENPAISGVRYIYRPGSYGIIFDKHGKVAVIPVDDQYYLPGGGIDEGETEVECLFRELKEEMALQAIDYKYLGQAVDNFYSAKHKKYFSIHGYYFLVLDYNFYSGFESEHQYYWIPPSEALPDFDRKAQAYMLEAYLNYKF